MRRESLLDKISNPALDRTGQVSPPHSSTHSPLRSSREPSPSLQAGRWRTDICLNTCGTSPLSSLLSSDEELYELVTQKCFWCFSFRLIYFWYEAFHLMEFRVVIWWERATGLGTTGDFSHSLCIPLSVSLEKIRKMSCGFSERRFVIFHSWDQSWLERSCMKSQLKSSNKTIHFSLPTLTHWRNDSLIVKPAVSEWWLWGKYNNKMVMDHWYANNVIH